MKRNDPQLSPEERKSRDEYIDTRWGQLHALAKENNALAHNYLFTTNAGGAVAVLAFLGATCGAGEPVSAIKIALGLFFIGLILVGALKAYMVHYSEGLFDHYREGASKHFRGEILWEELARSDENKANAGILPYVLGYGSFAAFILGCIIGACGIL